jgi:hypothetical protein
MPWVRLDDQFPDHPKIDQAGPLAGWLYVCGLAYCNRQLTDGFIPKATMPRLSTVPAPAKHAAALVAAGLWDAVEGGWQVHDYLDFQPAREKVLAERAANAERQRLHRERKQAKSQRDNGVTAPDVQRESQDPDPTRPTPLTSVVALTPVPGSERDTTFAGPTDEGKAAIGDAKRALGKDTPPVPAPKGATA